MCIYIHDYIFIYIIYIYIYMHQAKRRSSTATQGPNRVCSFGGRLELGLRVSTCFHSKHAKHHEIVVHLGSLAKNLTSTQLKRAKVLIQGSPEAYPKSETGHDNGTCKASIPPVFRRIILSLLLTSVASC